MSELALFLRQQSRPLKLATLETLVALVRSNAERMTPDLFEVRILGVGGCVRERDFFGRFLSFKNRPVDL